MSFLIKLLCCLHNRRINSSVVFFFFSWKMHSWFNVYSCFMIYSRTCHLFWHVKNIHIHIFFPLSVLFGIFYCYSVILVQERRHYDLSFLVLCCCLIIFFFFLPRNYLLFSKHLLKCTTLSEPFSFPVPFFHCGHTKTFWSLSLHWSLSLQNCLLHMWNPYYSNMKILVLNPYRSFIFLLLRKGICLIEHAC